MGAFAFVVGQKKTTLPDHHVAHASAFLVAFLCSVFLSAVQPPHLTISSPLSKDPVSELSAMCHFDFDRQRRTCVQQQLVARPSTGAPPTYTIHTIHTLPSGVYSYNSTSTFPLTVLPKEGADCLGLPTSLFLIADSSGLKHASHTINSAPPDPYLSHEPDEPMACPSVCLSVHSRDGEPPLRPSSTGHSWARETGRSRLQEPRPLRLCLGTRDGVVVSTFYETDVVRPSSSYPQASPESLQGAVQTQPYPPRPRARPSPRQPPGAGDVSVTPMEALLTHIHTPSIMRRWREGERQRDADRDLNVGAAPHGFTVSLRFVMMVKADSDGREAQSLTHTATGDVGLVYSIWPGRGLCLLGFLDAGEGWRGAVLFGDDYGFVLCRYCRVRRFAEVALCHGRQGSLHNDDVLQTTNGRSFRA
ncbi:uncharacterized protein CLUP02_15327 [Colletotrichum lupini]|uniref:Uncharacterized protein n=1 Tax=Colletotrichum lupini TaxID=145971 RepID=A0A9Q8WNK6_9PEZI|nr:uncharacterized protein CLUP02_15327 [Colletotrichum lupini]UQC89796.1 hypothetical protein CLUP02_15327 [Colletotrichum lupini]